MAEETSTGSGGGCVKTEQVDPDLPVGDDWLAIVERLRRDAAKQARAHLEKQDETPGYGEVEVRITMAAFLRFPIDEAGLQEASGNVHCVCTNDGEVCVCSGQCDFDACCKGAPAPDPPVVLGFP